MDRLSYFEYVFNDQLWILVLRKYVCQGEFMTEFKQIMKSWGSKKFMWLRKIWSKCLEKYLAQQNMHKNTEKVKAIMLPTVGGGKDWRNW